MHCFRVFVMSSLVRTDVQCQTGKRNVFLNQKDSFSYTMYSMLQREGVEINDKKNVHIEEFVEFTLPVPNANEAKTATIEILNEEPENHEIYGNFVSLNFSMEDKMAKKGTSHVKFLTDKYEKLAKANENPSLSLKSEDVELPHYWCLFVPLLIPFFILRFLLEFSYLGFILYDHFKQSRLFHGLKFILRIYITIFCLTIKSCKNFAAVSKFIISKVFEFGSSMLEYQSQALKLAKKQVQLL